MSTIRKYFFVFLLVYLLLPLYTSAVIPQNETTASEAAQKYLNENAASASKDKALLFGGCEFDPFQFLLQKDIYTPGAQSATEGTNGIHKLNADFACRLAKYIKATAAQCKITVFSAYRSPESQAVIFNAAVDKYGSVSAARKWAAPPPCSANTKAKACGRGSRHNFGLAADIHFNGQKSPQSQNCIAAKESAKQFNLHFPLPNEAWHIEPNGSVSNETSGSTESPSPSSGMSDAARQFLTGLTGQSTQQQALSQQQAIQCAMQGGSWYTLNSMTGQGICQPGTNQQPQAPTSPQMPSTPQTSGSGTSGSGGTTGSTGGSSGSTNTPGNGSTNTTDPVLVCAQEASDPVCGKQTTCPSVVSPNGTCTVGAKKTYLNTCLLNVDKATLISQGKCPQTTQDELDTLAQPNTPKKETKPITTVTLVEDPAATVGELKDQSTNAFTAAPRPGTPSYEQQRLTPQQSVSQQTFSDPSIAVIPGSFVSGQTTNTTFIETALANIVSALSRLQELLTPMKYTMMQNNADGTDVEMHVEDMPELINEEGIEIYIEE